MLAAIAPHGVPDHRRLQTLRPAGRLRGGQRVPPFIIDYLQHMDPFEATGLVSGLLCVLLLIRQNIWNWPIGLLYSVVSVVVFYRSRLYAELPLQMFYIAMNAYGWYYWAFAKQPARPNAELPVTNITFRTSVVLTLIVTLVGAATGWLFANRTNAALPYWDSAATTMSFAAMWMTARKQIENWYVWLAVDILETGIYLVKGIELYAVLYCVYIGMAVAGWWAWRTSQRRAA
jgi:nicotinamide mononucleotide transporter